jgi:hypothetical protein
VQKLQSIRSLRFFSIIIIQIVKKLPKPEKGCNACLLKWEKKAENTIFDFFLRMFLIIFCISLGSVRAPCRWFLLLGRVRVAFIERRLSLLSLFIIFSVLIELQ